MTRWISADDNTAQALRGRQIASDVGPSDPIDAALDAPSAVLVLPAGGSEVVVARVRRGAQPAAFEVHRWTDESAVGYTAGGMLGLLDEPVYEEEEEPKKSWWRRIVE
jgi:hypothetical protein